MTVGAIVDRLYRTYLYPPDARPPQAQLGTTVNTTDTSIVFGTFVVPEDEELLNVGSQIEIGSELMQITAYDELTTTATVIRNVGGTTAAAHTSGDFIVIAPPYTRLSVFEAVADNIITLYPKLYTVNHGSIVTMTGGIAPLDDTLAVEIVDAWPDGFSSADEVSARMVDFHPSVGGRAVVADMYGGQIWVRYRRRFGDASSEADTLLSLGMEERWVNIVMAGAAGDIMAGRDISKSTSEWVSGVLEAESVPVGTRGDIARRLGAYRSYLLDNASKEMKAEYKATTHMRDAGRVRVRSPFG